MIEQTGLLSEFADLPALLKQKEAFAGMLKELEADLLRIQKIKIDLSGGNSSTKETIATMKQAQSATEAFAKSTKQFADVQVAAAKETKRLSDELVRSSTKLAAAETQEAKANAIVREELRKKNAETKNAVREETAARGSIEQLRASLIRLQRTYDNLSASQRNSKLGKSLLKEIQGVSTEVKILEAQTNRFQRNVGNYKSAFGGLADSIGSLAKAYLGIFAAEKIIGFIGDSVKEFNEAEDGVNRLDSTLTNVGRNDALPRLQEKAKALMNEFKTVDDDEVIHVFDQLITYGKLTENQIDELLPVIINFAAKQRISLSESASVIIKALEGNGKALKEYGIDIKDAKGTTEAFSLVMGELAPRVEGAAKAFGETTRGQIKATSVEIGNLKEQIGEDLQPAIKKFYQFLAQGINGIPQLFSGAANFIDRIVTKINTSFRIAIALSKFDFEGAKKIKEEVELNEQRINDEKELLRIREKAASIGDSVAGMSEEEQAKAIKQQIALRDASAAYLKNLREQGKANTAEGRAAALRLIEDQQILASISASIARSKDNRILGKGGKLEGDDTTALRAQRKKFFDDELREQVEQNKKLSEVATLETTSRIAARKRAADAEKAIAEGERDAELQNEIDKLNAVKGKKGASANEITNAVNEFKQREVEINQKANAAIRKAELDLNNDLVEIKQSGIARQRDIDKKANEDTLKFFEETNKKKVEALLRAQEQQISLAATDKDIDVERLNKQYEKRILAAKGNQKKIEKVEREFAEKRADIEFEYATRILRIQIDSAEKIKAAKQEAGLDVITDEKTIAEAKIALSDLVTEHQLKNDKKEIQSFQEKMAAIEDKINKAKGYSDAISDLISGAIEAVSIADRNRLQEQSDLIDKRKDKEIKAVEESVASEQDKAAQIAVIDARTQTQKEDIARRQRQIEERTARFNKIKSIADIVLNTALAVIKALATPPVPNVGAAAIAGAIGAAQLAVAIATPIPKYAKGTGFHPGGAMIVGDGGKPEVVEYPTGERYVTPSTPTLASAPRGSKVYPDADKLLSHLMYSSMKSVPNAPLTADTYGKAMSQELGKKLDTLTHVVRNKREVHANATHSGITLTQKHLNSWLQYVDQKINF